MIVSLDTSVLIAALTVEPHSAVARKILGREATWAISDWALAEFSAAIRIKARRGDLASHYVPVLERELAVLVQGLGATFAMDAEDHRLARILIVGGALLRAPDALHIAAARRIGAALATLDSDQASACADAGVEVFAP